MGNTYSLFAGGEALDALALDCGIVRKHWFWIFKESDRSLRARVRDSLLSPFGVR